MCVCVCVCVSVSVCVSVCVLGFKRLVNSRRLTGISAFGSFRYLSDSLVLHLEHYCRCMFLHKQAVLA